MLGVGLAFVYAAVSRNMEPYELLPIGLGIVVANLPLTGLTDFVTGSTGVQESGVFGIVFHYGL
ncbi:MAG: sodium ion-translocating decarboxylase subunit beta, partial [Gemmatimonadetes bacterium]|nr:sodium ion-translocating decarboxylase subunit beta [Gemmatimonadota bacterium]